MPRDEDDWVGKPPEGRITRDRARPGFWANQWQARVATSIVGVVIVVAVLLVVLLA